ncbi:polysaccharide deacetylase family protein [Noviherbaspirillum cavernae]|nr:polysaccharide deacetylase family protein [Noviherbaspirillum cavernae]
MGLLFSCSIDDGHPSDLKMAELLSKHGLNGTFFVPINNSEGPDVMSRAQIRDIGRRFEIGSHTHDHRRLMQMESRDAHYQIIEGKKRLEDLLGHEVEGFCYPGGKYGQRDVALVKACGFSYARTVTNLCFDSGSNPFEMPTTVQFYPHRRAVYLRNYASAGHWLKRRAGLGVALRHGYWLKRIYAMFEHARRHETTFHLWAHSRDLDLHDAWHELDRFFGHVAAHVAPASRVTNAQLAAQSGMRPPHPSTVALPATMVKAQLMTMPLEWSADRAMLFQLAEQVATHL